MLDALHIPEPSDPWMYSFAVAGSFCKYLIERFGASKILQFYSQLKTRETIGDAIMHVYGEKLSVVEEDWRSLLRSIAEEDPDRVTAMVEVMLTLSKLSNIGEQARYIARQVGVEIPKRISDLSHLVDTALTDMYEAHPTATSMTLTHEVVNQYASAVQSWHEALHLFWIEVSIPQASGSSDYEGMLNAAKRSRELAVGLGADDLVTKIDDEVATILKQRALHECDQTGTCVVCGYRR
ncbi:MAG: hypothetical protein IMX01_08755 [Limnochordaceae bacterium]|nr:hypothetical protein [Limnochordaceae bacterium]